MPACDLAGVDSSSRGYVSRKPDQYPFSIPQNRRTKLGQGAPPTFQCHLCPQKFTRSFNLKSHLRTHTDERPFVCLLCGESFAQKQDRKLHEEMHSREKENRFVCGDEDSANSARSWGCGDRFANQGGLVRHFHEVGRACLERLLDEKLEDTGVFGWPSVILTQYPDIGDLDLIEVVSAWPNAPTRGASGLNSNDRKYESTLRLGYSKPRSILPIHGDAQAEYPHNALPLSSTSISPQSQLLSPLSSHSQDETDCFPFFRDAIETLEDSNKRPITTVLSSNKLDNGGFVRRVGLSSHETVSRGISEVANDDISNNSEGSLSPDESSGNSGSESGSTNTNKGSVLNYS